MNYAIQQLAALLGSLPAVQRLLRICTVDPNWDGYVENTLSQMCRERKIDPNDPHAFLPLQRAEDLYDADGFQLGRDHHTGAPVSITKDELARGVLILGAPGAGKTNLAFWLARHLDGNQ